jgi:class 3 adenylate cyclase
MSEDRKKGVKDKSSNIEESLQERVRPVQPLEKHRKELAVFLSEICGLTRYIDLWGADSARKLLFKHSRIVLPLIEEHKGRAVETIGDSVIASFPTSLAAVRAAIGIQKGLRAHNLKTEVSHRIQVAIGIHVGETLVEKEVISGDVVNLASRIQGEAKKDQILMSKAVYEQMGERKDIVCKRLHPFQVKGKAESLEVYKVVWLEDEDEALKEEPKS